MQRQRFITTIKNVTDKNKKKKCSKAQVDFIVPVKSTATTEGGKKGNQNKRIPKESTEQVKHKNNKSFS